MKNRLNFWAVYWIGVLTMIVGLILNIEYLVGFSIGMLVAIIVDMFITSFQLSQEIDFLIRKADYIEKSLKENKSRMENISKVIKK